MVSVWADSPKGRTVHKRARTHKSGPRCAATLWKRVARTLSDSNVRDTCGTPPPLLGRRRFRRSRQCHRRCSCCVAHSRERQRCTAPLSDSRRLQHRRGCRPLPGFRPRSPSSSQGSVVSRQSVVDDVTHRTAAAPQKQHGACGFGLVCVLLRASHFAGVCTCLRLLVQDVVASREQLHAGGSNM